MSGLYCKDKQASQEGFTLIELLVALVLGLLVSAAALQIFYTSSMNKNRQDAGSEIQDNAVFGLEDFAKHLRRANYGANANSVSKFYLNPQTPQGGVVLTRAAGTATPNAWAESNLYGLRNGTSALPASILSANQSPNSASRLATVNQSDQLTIQYQAYEDGMFTCTGEEITKDDYVIERYFIRADTTVTPNQNGLACAALIYTYDESVANSSGIDISSDIGDLTGNGVIIIPNVDYFRVLLGTTNQADFATNPASLSLRYRPIPADPVTDLAGQRIVSLQVGLLTHSNTPTATKQANNSLRFNVLDRRNQSLNEDAIEGPSYLRNVYESTVLIRNARGKP